MWSCQIHTGVKGMTSSDEDVDVDDESVRFTVGMNTDWSGERRPWLRITTSDFSHAVHQPYAS